jgi:hypothetical protein
MGDYQRAVLTQEENLKMAIANDRNVALARKQFKQGMLPELTSQQQRSKEEELTDIIANEAKAMENLLSLYSREKAAEFMNELSDDSLTYLNVYWNDIKPLLANKTGLNTRYFKRIVENHIKGITDARGMSTVPGTSAVNASINESEEIKKLGLYMLRDTNYIRKILTKIQKIPGSQAIIQGLTILKKFLPTDAFIRKVDSRPEGEKARIYTSIANAFREVIATEALWQEAADDIPVNALRKVADLFVPLPVDEQANLKQFYADIMAL